MRRIVLLSIIVLLLSACDNIRAIQPTPMETRAPILTSTLISTLPTETLTPLPASTPTQPLALLPTLTPLPNRTPAGNGAYFAVPSDVLGPQYEIQNAYYFDDPEGGQRYEIYAGAIVGSGDEYTAQGVVVVRILRVTEKNSVAYVETIETMENLTSLQVGPLRVDGSGYKDRYSGLLLVTSLDFIWFFNPYINEMYLIDAVTPLARLEVGENLQVATLKGESSVIATHPVPLTGRSPFIARLRLPLEEPPDALSLSAILVSPPGALQYDGVVTEESAEWRTDCSLCTPPIFRDSMELGKLPLLPNQELKVILEPGFYVLSIHATWLDTKWFGRIGATYAFLIELQE